MVEGKRASDYAVQLALVGAVLPLRLDFDHPGTIVDANDDEVLCVDYNKLLPDADVLPLAELIVLAVNEKGMPDEDLGLQDRRS